MMGPDETPAGSRARRTRGARSAWKGLGIDRIELDDDPRWKADVCSWKEVPEPVAEILECAAP